MSVITHLMRGHQSNSGSGVIATREATAQSHFLVPSPDNGCHSTFQCSLAVVLALIVYEWLLCIHQEVTFIWNWHSRGVTLSWLVYALSRYAMLIELLLMVASTFPLSDLVCHLTDSLLFLLND